VTLRAAAHLRASATLAMVFEERAGAIVDEAIRDLDFFALGHFV
jgi:hypothetical protein